LSGPQAACFFNTNVDVVLPLTSRVHQELPAEIRKKIGAAAKSGKGIEILLDKPLKISERGQAQIGGQAGNMANAFGALGVTAICHTNNGLSRERKLIDKRAFIVGPDSPPSIHIVLEWQAGGFLRAKKANRAILTFDRENAACKMDKRFERMVVGSAGSLKVAVMAGLHIANKGFANPILLGKKLMAKKIPVHFEFGSCGKSKALKILRLAKGSFQSFGCNEEEAKALVGAKHKALLRLTGASRAIVHGNEKIFVVFREKCGYSGDRTKWAGDYAAAVAAAKALTGHDPCREEVAALSEHGLIRRRPGPCKARCEKGIVEMVMPTWSAQRIRTTLGLGDSFIAAFLACEKGL
jgi:ADP-dependent phosphofructokinase/glucokinase